MTAELEFKMKSGVSRWIRCSMWPIGLTSKMKPNTTACRAFSGTATLTWLWMVRLACSLQWEHWLPLVVH